MKRERYNIVLKIYLVSGDKNLEANVFAGRVYEENRKATLGCIYYIYIVLAKANLMRR